MPDLKISQLPISNTLNSSDILPIVDNGSTKSTTLSGLQNFLGGVPTGAIMPFYLSSAPSGWVVCDGTTISNTGATAALYAAIGGTLPDLRGMFVRGSGTNASYTNANGGYYSGGAVGTEQNDQMQGHVHTYHNSYVSTDNAGSGYTGIGRNVPNDGGYPTTSAPTSDGVNGLSRTGVETRPANIAFLYCIKL